ncbi:MAG TPA: putative porin [Rhizomicrobium sp.]|nr:putative porin [Rhizomicrobium sp.]
MRGSLAAGVAAAALCLGAAPGLAQTGSGPSSSAMANLIRLLVKQKVITQASADALLKEAEQEAAQAKAANASVPATPVPIPAERPEVPPPAPGVLRVPYVPLIVRNQIRDEVKAEVLKEAKAENWAQPNALPGWIRHIDWYGLMRVRSESDFFGANNIGSDGIDGYVNYNAFNANGPTDVNPTGILNTIPFLNATQNRINLLSFSARLGMTANVSDNVQVGVQLASGGDNGPVSTTQAFGAGFTKKPVYLDLAYIALAPIPDLSITLGRMADPFFRTDLLFHDTLNMDGVEVSGLTKPLGAPGLGTFSTIGAFPVGYVNYNFPTFSPTKAPDHTEWLLGGQVGEDWANPRWDWRSAVSMYYYLNDQGELSAPCPIYLGTQQCSTDDSVPPYMEKGNTLFLLRDIIPCPGAPCAGGGTGPTDYYQPQYAGLLFKYEEFDATSTFDLLLAPQEHLIFTADYVRNLAYDGSLASRYSAYGVYPVTNYDSTNGALQSGPNAFMGRLTFGEPDPRERGEWNISAGYKYLQPDAVLDAFTDYDFHNGGTNAKGYFVKVTLGLFHNTWVQARWFSADQVYGPPLAIDVLQLDLYTAF